MLSRISTITFYILFVFTVLATATPGGWPPTKSKPPVTTTVTVTAPGTTTTITSDQCTTGSIQCCDSTETAGSATGSFILGQLGVAVPDHNVLFGINCSPLGIFGIGGGGCTSQSVCCEDNSVGSLISIGCIPIIL